MKNTPQFIDQIGRGKFLFDESLSGHTSFKIGGPADYFLLVFSQESLIEAVQAVRKEKIPFFILGGGTNLLIGDKGFRGLVIANKTSHLQLAGWKGNIQSRQTSLDSVSLSAESGVTTNRLVRFCLDAGLAGLEVFLGLPGTVGGAVVGNSHFEEQLFNDHLSRLTIFHPENGCQKILPQELAKFKKDPSLIILAAEFILTKADTSQLWLMAQKFLEKRKQTQPLNYPSAGCLFKNISQANAFRLGTPNYTRSAGYLIEACGLKGYQIGQVQISPLHANYLINLGAATASDVIELINLIKKRVLAKFQIQLEEEIIRQGEC